MTQTSDQAVKQTLHFLTGALSTPVKEWNDFRLANQLGENFD